MSLVRASVLAVTLVLVVACGGARSAAPDVAPFGETSRTEQREAAEGARLERLAVSREALDSDCARCHSEIAEEWIESSHARSSTNVVFRAEYDLEPSPFCAGCHAPLASASDPRAGVGRGVGCLLCHAPHALHEPEVAARVDLAPATRACADCHDFSFEAQREDPAYAPGQRLQSTASEWASSVAHARGESCASCHFPSAASRDGGTHVSHRLPGARDAEMLGASLAISATAAEDADGVRVELMLVSRAGHAVPTGDLFRALVVRAEDADRPMDGAGSPRDDLVSLGRHFDPSDEGLVEVLDDRVPADGSPRLVVLHLPRGTARVRWEVRWLALNQRLAASRGIPIDEARREVAHGVLAVEAAQARASVRAQAPR